MRRRFEIGNGHDPQFRSDTAHIREDAEWRSPARSGSRTAASRSPAHRPEDDDQRAELRREGVAGRPGGRHEPHLAQRHRGQLSLFDAIRGQLSYTSPEGKEYRVTAERRPRS
jgi:malate synthase